MNTSLTELPKKRGRKSETPTEKLARLERDLAAAKKAVAQAEARRLETIGSAVIAEAASNQEFHVDLWKVLRSRITAKGALVEIEQMLGAKKGSGKIEPASPAG